MDRIKRAETMVLALILVCTLVALPAAAQSVFSGEWLDIGHEDIEVDRRGGAVYGQGDTYGPIVASSTRQPGLQCNGWQDAEKTVAGDDRGSRKRHRTA